MKEYTATANEITGAFGAYNNRFISQDELLESVFYLLLESFDSFCDEQQKRVDISLSPTNVTLKMIEQISLFFKMNEYQGVRVSFEKWLGFLCTCESWLRAFEDYYPEYKGVMLEQVEPIPFDVPYKTYTYTVPKRKPHPEETHPEPMPQQQKKGKPIVSFRDCFICGTEEKENLLKRLHSILKGEKGKNTALAVLVCVENGKMKKPTFKAVSNEFGDVGNESGFNTYYSGKAFTDEEKTGMMKALFAK